MECRHEVLQGGRCLACGLLVHRYQVIGSEKWHYEVWEPTASIMNGHSSLHTFDGRWYGKVGTRPLPPELEAMPAMTEQRLVAVREYQDAQYQEAYRFIEQAYPQVWDAGQRCMGEVVA